MIPIQLRAQAELELRKRRAKTKYIRYQSDPVAFGVNELDELFTDDICTMMQSVRDNPVTIARSANGTGKTHGAARVAIWFYLSFPGAQVFTAAAPPEDNLKTLLWGEINSITEHKNELFTGHKINTLSIEKSAQEFVKGVTIPASGTPAQREARFSGKHAPYLLFILDEADAIPPEVYRGIESCMSGGHARLLCLFNPRHESGELARMESAEQANIVEITAFNHPNVRAGQDQIPGAVTRETTVRRINEWTRALADDESPEEECFQVPNSLVGCVAKSLNGETEYPPLAPGWRKITNSAFSYMVLAQYPSQGSNQLINRADVNAAVSRWLAHVETHGEKMPSSVQPIMGQDVAEFGDDSNVAIFRYGGFVTSPRKWGGVDTIVTGDRASALYKEYDAYTAKVDGTGVGAGVAPHMMRLNCSADSVKVASSPTYQIEEGVFDKLRDQLWWSLREWLRTDAGSMIPPNDELIEELLAPTYEIKNGKIKIMDKATMKEVLGRSPDVADALCLTFDGADYGGASSLFAFV